MFSRFFQHLFQHNKEIILLANHNGQIIDANDAAIKAYGYNREELLAKCIKDLCAPGEVFNVADQIVESAGNAVASKILQHRKNGNIFPVEIISRSERIGEKELLLIIIRNISESDFAENDEEIKIAYEEIKEAYDELAKITYDSFNNISNLMLSKRKEKIARKQAELMSDTDYLTKVLNRRAFDKRLKAEINRAIRGNFPLGLILTDIDYFKNINDTYGHQAGDEVLKIFAALLLQQSRSYDFVGRYGGEEFFICLPGAGSEEAAKIAERICVALQKWLIPVTGFGHLTVTASFGVSVLKMDKSESIDTIIKRADEALYQAKMKGRNCVCLAY